MCLYQMTAFVMLTYMYHLEERSKMRKRILGAAVLFSFIVSLTAASNMKEDVKIKEVPAMEGLAAGSIRFAHSFTPESDEKTGIEKKKV